MTLVAAGVVAEPHNSGPWRRRLEAEVSRVCATHEAKTREGEGGRERKRSRDDDGTEESRK